MKTAQSIPTPLETVEIYAGLGPHRTGGAAEPAVTDWLLSDLKSRGATAELVEFPYMHFQSEVQITGCPRPIAAEMLYYCWAGETRLSNPLFGEVDAHASEGVLSDHIRQLAAKALSGGNDGLVLATQNPLGSICGINREIQPAGNLPIVLVAPLDFAELQSPGISFECRASVTPSSASNIWARFQGPNEQSPIVVTTPISGWYSCAGERGTGIAVALKLAQLFAKDHTVDLLLARGHELGFAGGYHIASNYPQTPKMVLHIGSCAADISANIKSWCSAPPGQFDRVAQSLAPFVDDTTRPSAPTNRHNWVGEAQCWASDAYPMLSIAGLSQAFHTPEDVVQTAATSRRLEETISAVFKAAGELLKN